VIQIIVSRRAATLDCEIADEPDGQWALSRCIIVHHSRRKLRPWHMRIMDWTTSAHDMALVEGWLRRRRSERIETLLAARRREACGAT
jgi:hypothetical protein